MPETTNASEVEDFPVFAVTVDVVVFAVIGGDLHVALIERGVEPFAGAWALPGGFKRPDETLTEAASRELGEETGVSSEGLRQFGAFGDPGRDPRGNVVTIGFYAVVEQPPDLAAGTDAASASYWPVRALLGREIPLAFDHFDILSEAHTHLCQELERSDLIKHFLPSEFTIRDLQEVYEAVWGCQLDPSNFRRSLEYQSSAWVESVPEGRIETARRGRPPKLFRFSGDWKSGGPIKRPV